MSNPPMTNYLAYGHPWQVKHWTVTVTSNRIRCRLIRNRIDALLHTNPWEAK